MADFLKIDSITQKIPNHPLNDYIIKNSLTLKNYDAYWVINENQLFLEDIYDYDEEYSLIKIFNLEEQQPVLADWFIGKIEIDSIPFEDSFYKTILCLQFHEGWVASHDFLLKITFDYNIIDFGRYCGYSFSEITKPQFYKEDYIENYLRAFIKYLFEYHFNDQIIVPQFHFTSDERSFLKDFRKNFGIKYHVTDRYILLDPDYNSSSLDKFGGYKGLMKKLFDLIIKILSKPHNSTKLLFRNRGYRSYFEKRSTYYLNCDFAFAKNYADMMLSANDIEAINAVFPDNRSLEPEFLIIPESLSNESQPEVESLEFKQVGHNLLEYKVKYKWGESYFTKEYIEKHKSIFEECLNVRYDESFCEYVHHNIWDSSHYIVGSYLQNIESIYHGLKKKNYGDNFYDPSMDPSNDWSGYDKYNGAYGYDDDTIDNAFEGDPENTWNID